MKIRGGGIQVKVYYKFADVVCEIRVRQSLGKFQSNRGVFSLGVMIMIFDLEGLIVNLLALNHSRDFQHVSIDNFIRTL